MKISKLILFFLLLLGQFAVAQKLPRVVLKGQIVNDSIGVENIKIENISIQKFVVSDKQGNFSLYARPKDTLVFSSFSYISKKIVLTDADFKLEHIRVKLESLINSLDEIIISPNSFTGVLEIDQKNIKITELPKMDIRLAMDQQFESDGYTSPVNTLMPGYVDTRFMPDLMVISKKIGKLFAKKKQPKKIEFITYKIFPEAVQEKFGDEFFAKTLQLKKDEIGLFLTFCENDSRARPLLEPKREFELIDFLVSKRKEYDTIKKE